MSSGTCGISLLFSVSLIIVKVMAAPSPGCEAGLPEVPHPGRHHRFEVVVADPGMGEVMRSYVLHLPAHYNTHNTDPTPLMIVGDFIHVETIKIATQDYHGWTGTAHDQMVNMPWRDLADTHTDPFILVTMEGMNDVDRGHWNSWNVSESEVMYGQTVSEI